MMSFAQFKKYGMVAAAVVLAVLMLASCAKGASTSGAAASSGKPYVITMLDQSIIAEPPKPDDPIIQAIEKLTNTQLQIQWVPGSTYNDKLNAMIAGGTLPMVVLVQTRPASLIAAMRSGFFWDLTPYLEEYPNVVKGQNAQVQRNLMLDGKVFSLFRSRSTVGNGLIYRKDWLDNLGMNPPKTLDDVYAMIKAFTLKDPDKDGKNDTIGFGEEQSVRGFNFILAAEGGGNQWDTVDGKLVPTIFSKAYLDAMNFYRRLFAEKLMNQDMPLTTRPQNIDNMDKGKIGVRMGDPDQITRQTQLSKLDPKADVEVIAQLQGVKGDRELMDTGYTGEFMFPKSSVKSEKDLKRILTFFDTMSKPEGQNLFEWGIEGTHYSIRNGEAARTPEQAAAYNSNVIQLEQTLQIADGSLAMKGQNDPAILKYRAAKAAAAGNLVPNPAASYVSNTWNDRSADLNKIINDARTKYIMGQIDEAGWKQALADWRAAGGDQVIKELNAEYAKDPNKIVIN